MLSGLAGAFPGGLFVWLGPSFHQISHPLCSLEIHLNTSCQLIYHEGGEQHGLRATSVCLVSLQCAFKGNMEDYIKMD